jgi:hypothetical protein
MNNNKLYTIDHPQGHITIPSTITDKYSFFSLQSNTQLKQEKITLQEFDYKHIKQFFDLVENKPSSILSWQYWNNSPITDEDVEPLLHLNNFLSAGIAEQQAFITTSIANRLKARPKDIYKNLPLLTLYEQIFDSADKPTQKLLAMQADNQNDHTSFCCALYMAMYNPNVSTLWNNVGKDTKFDIDHKTMLDINAELKIEYRPVSGLEQWYTQDPARILFGKCMDALNRRSIWLNDQPRTSLHEFYYCTNEKFNAENKPNISIKDPIDRTHLPLIAKFHEYNRTKFHVKYEYSFIHIDKLTIGNKSIRRLYDVDTMALANSVFSPKATIDISTLPTACFDNLDSMPEKIVTLNHVPLNINEYKHMLHNKNTLSIWSKWYWPKRFIALGACTLSVIGAFFLWLKYCQNNLEKWSDKKYDQIEHEILSFDDHISVLHAVHTIKPTLIKDPLLSIMNRSNSTTIVINKKSLAKIYNILKNYDEYDGRNTFLSFFSFAALPIAAFSTTYRLFKSWLWPQPRTIKIKEPKKANRLVLE